MPSYRSLCMENLNLGEMEFVGKWHAGIERKSTVGHKVDLLDYHY